MLKNVDRICQNSHCGKPFKCYGDCSQTDVRLKKMRYCTCPECVKRDNDADPEAHLYLMCKIRKEAKDPWSIS